MTIKFVLDEGEFKVYVLDRRRLYMAKDTTMNSRK